MISAYDQKLRDERVSSSFRAVVYGGLSTATFIGVLAKVITATFEAVGAGAATKMGVEGITEVGKMFGPVGIALTVGFLAAGTFFAYMGQKEWTKTKCIDDELLARKTLECQHEKIPSKSQTIQFDEPEKTRAGDKSWVQTIAANENQLAQGAAR